MYNFSESYKLEFLLSWELESRNLAIASYLRELHYVGLVISSIEFLK